MYILGYVSTSTIEQRPMSHRDSSSSFEMYNTMLNCQNSSLSWDVRPVFQFLIRRRKRRKGENHLSFLFAFFSPSPLINNAIFVYSTWLLRKNSTKFADKRITQYPNNLPCTYIQLDDNNSLFCQRTELTQPRWRLLYTYGRTRNSLVVSNTWFHFIQSIKQCQPGATR